MYEPLAERMRPKSLNDYIGQKHLARIIAEQTKVPFYTLSAVTSGVKEVREVLDRCRVDANSIFTTGRPVLFIDEIHRFNKSQQDSLLGAVEQGTVTLIGATTENPSFEVIRPLLSRAQVYVLEPLGKDDLLELLDRAIKTDRIFQDREVRVEETEALMRFSGGDARKLLNILDLIYQSLDAHEPFVINDQIVTDRLQQNPLAFDKNGEMHYDIISAFIKSIRGSDPDAAVYWLARLIAGGEDPKFIARRMCISAAEDIGLANPNALLLANATFDIINKIGWPEGRIPLSECAIYLATSEKSNSAYLAIDGALALVNQTGNLPVPLHLRNAPTKLMKELLQVCSRFSRAFRQAGLPATRNQGSQNMDSTASHRSRGKIERAPRPPLARVVRVTFIKKQLVPLLFLQEAAPARVEQNAVSVKVTSV